MMQFHIVLMTHRHGTDTWPVFGKCPTEDALKKDLEEKEGVEPEEWDRLDTYLEVVGPFDYPLELTNAITAVLDSEDNTGCTEDLTVASLEAIEKLREASQ